MTAGVDFSFIRRKLSGAPLSTAVLKRMLVYDEQQCTLVWVRRKRPVVVDKHGNINVRGHAIPAHFLVDTIRDNAFPEWGEPMFTGITKQGGRYMVMIYYGDKAVFGGIYGTVDQAKSARAALANYFIHMLEGSNGRKAMSALTGARSDNSTGYRGVSYMASRKKYIGRVTVDLKTYSVGSFTTPQDAYRAVLEEEDRLRCK